MPRRRSAQRLEHARHDSSRSPARTQPPERGEQPQPLGYPARISRESRTARRKSLRASPGSGEDEDRAAVGRRSLRGSRASSRRAVEKTVNVLKSITISSPNKRRRSVVADTSGSRRRPEAERIPHAGNNRGHPGHLWLLGWSADTRSEDSSTYCGQRSIVIVVGSSRAVARVTRL